MSRLKRILIVGIGLAMAILGFGHMLYENADQRLRSLERQCGEMKDDFGGMLLDRQGKTIPCTYGNIRWFGQNSSDIHAEILKVGDTRKRLHIDNVSGAAFVVFFASALPVFFLEFIPWLWHFLLARIRELSDAIAGRSKP